MGGQSDQHYVNQWGEGAKYYGSEILSAASIATCDDVAFLTLFERYDNYHAH